jgi:hypothetical protein
MDRPSHAVPKTGYEILTHPDLKVMAEKVRIFLAYLDPKALLPWPQMSVSKKSDALSSIVLKIRQRLCHFRTWNVTVKIADFFTLLGNYCREGEIFITCRLVTDYILLFCE